MENASAVLWVKLFSFQPRKKKWATKTIKMHRNTRAKFVELDWLNRLSRKKKSYLFLFCCVCFFWPETNAEHIEVRLASWRFCPSVTSLWRCCFSPESESDTFVFDYKFRKKQTLNRMLNWDALESDDATWMNFNKQFSKLSEWRKKTFLRLLPKNKFSHATNSAFSAK